MKILNKWEMLKRAEVSVTSKLLNLIVLNLVSLGEE